MPPGSEAAPTDNKVSFHGCAQSSGPNQLDITGT
ncbi:hypothetical protein E9229_003894 [Paeniglutamicibacter cryotolerans]|uniref:Uncharacterized protein n=1 Tax=Paeniglutamicibacter cryotolerans TaxID=670079 RepID=A0A839QWE0_9MICC|nr:hypothetical protein [Paeniglutamicibacter cryotolerans]